MHFYMLVSFAVCLFATTGCQPPLAGSQNAGASQQPSGGEDIDQVFDHHDPAVEDMRMSVDEVAAHISGTGNWKPVTLTETGVGKYESDSVTRDNRRFSMEVRQTKQGVYWRWTNEDGSSGGSAMTTW